MRQKSRVLTAADLEAVADAVAARLANQRPAGPDAAFTGIAGAAAYLAISGRSVQQLIYSGRLPSRLIGARRVIPWSDLRAFARAGDHPEPIAPSRRAARPDAAEPEVAE
jgi:hypothetical protein